MKHNFEPSIFERINFEKCDHEFIRCFDEKGWESFDQCRKCFVIKIADKIFSADELYGRKEK